MTGQPAARRDLAEQYVGERPSALRARVEALQYRVAVAVLLDKADAAAADIDKDNRFAELYNLVVELLLYCRQLEVELVSARKAVVRVALLALERRVKTPCT